MNFSEPGSHLCKKAFLKENLTECETRPNEIFTKMPPDIKWYIVTGIPLIKK